MTDTTLAVFTEHSTAEAAIRKLAGAGFPMRNFSIVGQGYHTEEEMVRAHARRLAVHPGVIVLPAEPALA